jgi:hypothetical protein
MLRYWQKGGVWQELRVPKQELRRNPWRLTAIVFGMFGFTPFGVLR